MEKKFNLFYPSVLLLSVLLFLFSCNEDKGNYDYSEINDLDIAEFKVKNATGDYITKGESETFYNVTVEAGDNLVLTPELAFISGDEADYSFNGMVISEARRNRKTPR